MPFSPFAGYQGASSSSLPPELQQKQMLARYLMQDASQMQSPTSLGVLARALQGGLAGYAQNDATNAIKERETSYNETMARALQAGSGQGNTFDSQSGKWSDPTGKADPQLMASVLAGNKDTAPMGLQFQMQNMQQSAAAEAALRKMQAEYGLKLAYEPQIAGATEQAKNPALLAREEGKAGVDLRFAGPKAAATESATLPLKKDLAAHNASLDIAKAGPIAEATAAAQAPGKEFDRANTLRDEFNTLTKDFRTVQDAYSKIKATSDTGAGDMSMLYSYVKLLDPGSVVRESEFATAAASGSFGERVQGAAQRLLTGERMADSLRESFKNEADKIYQAQKLGYDKTAENYKALAGRYNLDPSNVIQDYATAPPAPGATGGIKFLGFE